MVTNLNVAKCANAADVYHRSTVYAVKQLDLPNVAQYLDAGHAGWLGWPANQPGAADVFSKVYIEAGKPKSLRGLATNVSNYNAWSLSSPPSYTTPNPVYDEKKFVEALGPLLENKGWTGVKFIVDQGRSGKQPTGQLVRLPSMSSIFMRFFSLILQFSRNGVTGATPSALASVLALPPTLVAPGLMPLFGSSLVVRGKQNPLCTASLGSFAHRRMPVDAYSTSGRGSRRHYCAP